MATKSEHAGHRQRMKNKMLVNGLDVFENHEVLEMLLFYAIPMKDTNPLAHKLIDDFGSLSAVLDAPYDRLKAAGLSDNAVSLMKFIPQFLEVYKHDKFKNENKVLNRRNIPEMFVNQYIGKTNEETYLLLLDPKMRELYFGNINKGTLSKTELNITKICELAVSYHARYVAVAHNHPSGNNLPSYPDIVATINLKQALKPLQIDLLDHYIVADDDAVSFNDAHVLFDSYEEFIKSECYHCYFDRFEDK